MIRVVVADGELLVRKGICSVLRASGRFNVVAEADDGHRALETVRRHKPDVMLVDFNIPGMGGIGATQILRREQVLTKVIVLATEVGSGSVYQSFRSGAAGFLVKGVTSQELVGAILAVSAGEQVLSPAVTKGVIDRFLQFDYDRVRSARTQVESLTLREREVLAYVVKGVGNAKIARMLYVSEGAIKAHVSNILAKLQCANRVQAAILAHESGLFSGRDPVIPQAKLDSQPTQPLRGLRTTAS